MFARPPVPSLPPAGPRHVRRKLAVVAALAALSAWPHAAQAQAVIPWRAVCAPAAAARAALERAHGERPLFEAATAEGFRLVVLVSPAGSYSVAVEIAGPEPGQRALCVLSIGTGFAPAAPDPDALPGSSRRSGRGT